MFNTNWEALSVGRKIYDLEEQVKKLRADNEELKSKVMGLSIDAEFDIGRVKQAEWAAKRYKVMCEKFASAIVHAMDLGYLGMGSTLGWAKDLIAEWEAMK